MKNLINIITDLSCRLSDSGQLLGVLDAPCKQSIDLGNGVGTASGFSRYKAGMLIDLQ